MRRADRSRPSGGGSTPTSTTGAPTGEPRCAPCTPLLPTPCSTSPKRPPQAEVGTLKPAKVPIGRSGAGGARRAEVRWVVGRRRRRHQAGGPAHRGDPEGGPLGGRGRVRDGR